jgi:hypothetical protein
MERVGAAPPVMVRVGMADAGRTQTLSATILPEQDLFLRLSADGAPGRLEDEPTYQLVYQLNDL